MGLFKAIADLTLGLGAQTEPPAAATQPLDPVDQDTLRRRLFACVEQALADRIDREPFVASLFKLAAAVAFIDGEIVEAERREMDGFLAIATRVGFSPASLKQFRAMYDAPPTCQEALAEIEALGVAPALVSDLVHLLVNADGKVTVEEFELLARLSPEPELG